MRFLTLICGILGLCLLSCSQDLKHDYLPVDFTVNADMLGTSYHSQHPSFSIDYPRDVHIVDSIEVLNFRESIQADTNAYLKITLLDMKRADSGLVVTISLIDSLESASNILDDSYLEQLKTTFSTNSVIRNEVSINQIPTIQFIVTSKDLINIKLFMLFEPNIIQVDYFIRSDQYYALLEQIESSIGSISRNYKEEKK